MRTRLAAFLMILTICPGQAQKPRILLAANAASVVPAGTPYYGIAQGSVFAVTGLGLGPATKVSANLDEAPLSTSLGEVSVEIRPASGDPVQALLYSASTNLIMALAPSSTPVGRAAVVVTYQGTASDAFPIEILAVGFGIATTLETGLGNVSGRIVSEDGGSVLSLTNAANPGETISIDGTGLGATTLDETVINDSETDMPDTPVEVFFGPGVKGEIVFRGRSRRPGWDRIEVIVPEGVKGCYVALYVKNGSFVSNFPTVPIAEVGSRQCVDGRGFLPTSTDSAVYSDQPVHVGSLLLGRFAVHTPAIGGLVPAMTTTLDSASGMFLRYAPGTWLNYAGPGEPEPGGCIVVVAVEEGTFGEASRPEVTGILDAGPSLTLRTPPGGSLTLTKTPPVYGYNSQPPARPLFLAESGTFEFVGTGGSDIGAFQARLPVGPVLRWTNRAAITATALDRTKGLEVTWTGGGTDADSYVRILGASARTNPKLTTNFLCSERVSKGKFTIPAEVMSSMVASTPATGAFALPTGSLSVSAYRFPVGFTAPGLGIGTALSFSSEQALVNFR